MPDFADVKGNEAAKRALVVAAAGGHGILMMGSPGSGKTMMAKRIPYIMPEMTYGEMLEVTRIHSAAGSIGDDYVFSMDRPFRAPHHTITKAAMIGGGSNPYPGEISMAHNGVLFLDEFGEFDPSIIELLRQPIEDGSIRISRARRQVEFPCRLMLVAAANPCKCGYYGDEQHLCTCSSRQLESYFSRFSGPVLDRIDMHISVRPVREEQLNSTVKGMSTEEMKNIVEKAVQIQKARYKRSGTLFNGRLRDEDIKEVCCMDRKAEAFMQEAYNKLGISMRSYNKILKVSRTIADINKSEKIKTDHIAEALQYRSLEAFYRR